jgi:hypothetical protein
MLKMSKSSLNGDAVIWQASDLWTVPGVMDLGLVNTKTLAPEQNMNLKGRRTQGEHHAPDKFSRLVRAGL